MKFIMFVKGDENTESGILPDVNLFVEMEKYNDKLKEAGVLITLDGLQPSSKGVRVSFSGNNTAIKEGPFQNPKELVAGYWIINVQSKEDAIEWATQVPFTDGTVEIRPIQEISDFPEEIQKVLNQKD